MTTQDFIHNAASIGTKVAFILEHPNYTAHRTGEVIRRGEGLNYFCFIIASGGHEYCVHHTKVELI